MALPGPSGDLDRLFCNLLMVLAFYLVLVLPALEFFTGEAYALVLGMAPVVLASWLPTGWGICQCYCHVPIEDLTRGFRGCAPRSSLVGQLDTIIFITIVFWGQWETTLVQMIYQYLFKITYELLIHQSLMR